MVLWFLIFPPRFLVLVGNLLSAFIYIACMRYCVCSVVEKGTSVMPLKGCCCNFQSQM